MIAGLALRTTAIDYMGHVSLYSVSVAQMSNLRAIDLMVVEELVEYPRGRGYVLHFSDRDFSQFFATELNIDIDHPNYAVNGGSKGKRLKCFLQNVDDRTALKALKALWEVRTAFLARAQTEDPVKDAESQYLALVDRLGGSPAGNQKSQEQPKPAFNHSRFEELKGELLKLSDLQPQARGYAFERLLATLFKTFGLEPRSAFKITGEQIDGSFTLGHETYLLEAKWENHPVGAADLHVFQSKLEQKAAWARGLFVSYSGFSEAGLIAWGKRKSVICMDGLDLTDMLQRGLPLDHVLDRKIRRAAETGLPFVRVRELFN